MHQNRFRLGLRPRPSWGAYSTPPDPLAGFKGGLLRREGREGRGREGKGGKGRGGREEGRREGRVGWSPLCEILNTPLPRTPLFKGRGGNGKGGEEREGKGKGRREGKDIGKDREGKEGGRGGMRGEAGRGGALDMGSAPPRDKLWIRP